ncbi:MAG TPA: hypothetical protein VMW08_00340 [Acidimicrobiales bacterium]|nr:hypothetical protein [Acidimicrobiales bacterium]
MTKDPKTAEALQVVARVTTIVVMVLICAVLLAPVVWLARQSWEWALS